MKRRSRESQPRSRSQALRSSPLRDAGRTSASHTMTARARKGRRLIVGRESSASQLRAKVDFSVGPAGHQGIGRISMLDDQDVVRLLRAEVARAGGQSSWARQEGIDRTLLNRVLCGRRQPTEHIVKALKLCNVYARTDRATVRVRQGGQTCVKSIG
jgi:hypothetical protein